MTTDEQLVEWAKGNNLHNPDRDECCPDFSCCQDFYHAPLAERQIFVARPELRHKMLMMFLSAVMSARYGKAVHVSGSIEGSA